MASLRRKWRRLGGGSRQQTHCGLRGIDQRRGGDSEHIRPGARRRPNFIVSEKTLVEINGEVVADWRNSSNRKSRGTTYSISVSPVDRTPARGLGKLVFVEPSVTWQQHHRRLAIDHKYQGLHNLTNLYADCDGRVPGCLRALRKGPGFYLETTPAACSNHGSNIAVHRKPRSFRRVARRAVRVMVGRRSVSVRGRLVAQRLESICRTNKVRPLSSAEAQRRWEAAEGRSRPAPASQRCRARWPPGSLDATTQPDPTRSVVLCGSDNITDTAWTAGRDRVGLVSPATRDRSRHRSYLRRRSVALATS